MHCLFIVPAMINDSHKLTSVASVRCTLCSLCRSDPIVSHNGEQVASARCTFGAGGGTARMAFQSPSKECTSNNALFQYPQIYTHPHTTCCICPMHSWFIVPSQEEGICYKWQLHLCDALYVHCAFGTKNIIASMVCPVEIANLVFSTSFP